MEDVFPLMLGFRIQLCDLHALFLVPFGAGLFPGQFPLFPGKFRFHAPVRFLECRGVAVVVHVQVRHGIIQSDAALDGRLRGYLRFWVFHQDGVIPFPVRLLGDRYGFQLPSRFDLKCYTNVVTVVANKI